MATVTSNLGTDYFRFARAGSNFSITVLNERGAIEYGPFILPTDPGFGLKIKIKLGTPSEYEIYENVDIAVESPKPNEAPNVLIKTDFNFNYTKTSLWIPKQADNMAVALIGTEDQRQIGFTQTFIFVIKDHPLKNASSYIFLRQTNQTVEVYFADTIQTLRERQPIE